MKFPNTHALSGYGFDIIADRVVRFNKHPDGTYLNTRATYSINGNQYTHFDIRSQALSLKEPMQHIVTSSKFVTRKRLFLVAVLFMVVTMFTNCTVNFSVSVNSQIIKDESNERKN